MALNPTTPGVYVQELNSFPPSVAPVSTAIPAFIGYTEKGPTAATRITSMLEYRAIFGGAYGEQYTATIDSTGTFTGVAPTGSSESPYVLFYHLEMYFGNGGGPCYIISVDNYQVDQSVDASKFFDLSDPSVGIGKAESASEVTLLVVPEAVSLSDADMRATYDAMLAQCSKLKNRFCIFDVKNLNPGNPNPVTDGDAFRNIDISANSLDYGAAYYPPLNTILHRNYLDDDVRINDTQAVPFYVQPNNRLATVNNGKGGFKDINVAAAAANGDAITITVAGTIVTLTVGIDIPYNVVFTPDIYAASIISVINAHPILSLVARAQLKNASTTEFYIVARTGSASVGVKYTSTSATFLSPQNDNTFSFGVDNSANTALYTTITNAIAARILTLGASGTMAGIYANVDNDRGVWKAPANVSVANIIGPSVTVTEAQQGNLNVDATSGKSINVIRAFTGRGTLVWGARTLDGNSNEWRYVPVRRLFIFAETSIKLACESMVFEPNDKNTWLTVKGLIGNFLNDLWRQGALAGDKPDQAYFVRVGLGETMTAQDILEGKMIVTIGMAAVRPAEFIILQFVQTLQQS